MQCPKCGYVRVAVDRAPDYECPSCGIVYAKFDPATGEREALIRAKLAARIEAQAGKGPADNKASEPAANKVAVEEKPPSSVPPAIPGNTAVCKNCEEIGSVTTKLPGSGWVEFVLYPFFFAPGIIYSTWRRKGVKQVCSACGSDQLVAAKTRAGKLIITNQYEVFTIASDAESRQIQKPSFGKFTAILIGLFAVMFFINAAWIGFGAVRTSESKPMLFLVMVLLAVGTWLAWSAYRFWKPGQVFKPKVGQGLIGL